MTKQAGTTEGPLQRFSTLAACVAMGLALGVLAGVLLNATRAPESRASTAITILPDASLTTLAGSVSPNQDASAFIQSELIVLNGESLRTQVQEQLGLSSPPRVSSSQVGLTFVVDITATAGNDAQATAVAGAVSDLYTQARESALTDSLATAIASVGTQIDSVNRSLQAPGTTTPNDTGNVNPQADAQRLELGRLLSLNNSLTLAKGQVSQVVTTLQPPVLVGASALESNGVTVLGGALLGALLAVVVILALRRYRSTDRGPERDMAALGVPVLRPALPHAVAHSRQAALDEVGSAARLLGARTLRRGPDGSGALVLFGAREGVGTSFAAQAVAARLAESGPVLLLLAAELVGGPDTDLESMDGPAGADATGLLSLPPGPLTAEQVWDASEESAISGVRTLARGRGARRPAAFASLLRDGLLEAAGATGALVVVDAPSLGRSSTTVELARRAGGAVLVVSAEAFRGPEAAEARDVFQAQGVELIGILLNSPGRLRPGRPSSGGASRVPADELSAQARDMPSTASRSSSAKGKRSAPRSRKAGTAATSLPVGSVQAPDDAPVDRTVVEPLSAQPIEATQPIPKTDWDAPVPVVATDPSDSAPEVPAPSPMSSWAGSASGPTGPRARRSAERASDGETEEQPRQVLSSLRRRVGTARDREDPS